MSIDHQHDDMMDMGFTQSNEPATKKKFKKINILVFFLCIVLAFAFWCYALHVNDPVIKKTVAVELVLVGGAEDEALTSSQSIVEVYGVRSALGSVDKITVKVDRGGFSAYDKDRAVTLTLPQNIESKTEQISVRLVKIPAESGE